MTVPVSISESKLFSGYASNSCSLQLQLHSGWDCVSEWHSVLGDISLFQAALA